jgi:hypothetical protein
MSKSRLVSGRIKKTTGDELSADRYEFLDLANAEPDLGIPSIGESILVGDIDGTRSWVDIATYSEEFKGFTGSQGEIGFTGSQGAAGFAGSAGTDGIIGMDGYTGSQGFTGSQGAGFTGSQGERGDTGFTGSQGEIGYTGSQGPVGEGGGTGFVGSQGGVGFTGSQGERGFTGSQGEIGYTGSQGVIGFTGSQGVVGFVGSQGGQGGLGFTGSRGANGNRSVALSQEGLLVARVGAVRWYAPAALSIQEITFRLDLPADQIATIVVKKSGVATRTINMTVGQVKAVNSDAFAMAADEYLTVDVTATGAPGATTQGSGLNVIFLYQFTSL